MKSSLVAQHSLQWRVIVQRLYVGLRKPSQMHVEDNFELTGFIAFGPVGRWDLVS